MLENRKRAVEKINELFGTNISIELNDEIYYEGSGNATLGAEDLEEEEVNGVPGEEIDEKNTEESIEIEEERGGENDNEKD